MTQPTPPERQPAYDATEAVLRLCEAYKDAPPPIFQGPGLSERGEGYNAGTRDLARAVLAMLSPVEVQQLIDALADCVVKATPYGVQDGDFVANYIMPTGPIHRAIPLLQERYGITVRPGFDGRTFSQPEEPA